jgi:hypothetical protein
MAFSSSASDRLAAEAAALDSDEQDRAEMLEVARSMTSLRSAAAGSLLGRQVLLTP